MQKKKPSELTEMVSFLALPSYLLQQHSESTTDENKCLFLHTTHGSKRQ